MAYEHKSLRHWIQSKVELTHESTSRIWPYLVTFRGVLLCSRGILYPCFCSWFLTLNFLLQARPQILGSSFSGKNIIFPSLSTTIDHQVLDLPSDCSSGLLPEGPALCLRGRNGKKMVSIKSLVPNCILACWSLLWSHLCNCLYRNPQGLCTADYVLWNVTAEQSFVYMPRWWCTPNPCYRVSETLPYLLSASLHLTDSFLK